ncbi:hypothetical protein [Nocardioides ochotonae]|uniref:hypothetical protein n=1 Tax=Nocardioides ochotonae TaxID=2685869 RepID=UPI0014073BD0|nr:hypothetical protein [Nocardioides ochotonae]
MEASRDNDGTVTVRMSYSEVVVLHEAIAFSEWGNDLREIELRQPAEQKVFSDLQQALVPLIPELGTDKYGDTVTQAIAQIDPAPY